MNHVRQMVISSFLVIFALNLSGCSTHKREIFFATLIGGAAGAGAGYAFVDHGRNNRYVTRDTVISGVIFALLFGGALAWHYRSVNEAEVALSGKYSRYRLCDSTNDPLADPSKFLNRSAGQTAWLPEQIGKYSITLDQTTRWVLPTFTKRWLAPETEGNQMISSHYIWEIVQPGYFLSKEKNPEAFNDVEKKEKK